MRVRLTIDADARDRYVIAKYFGLTARATRQQVRVFARGAIRAVVRQHADALVGRQRATARRLADGRDDPGPAIDPAPGGHQLNLLDGAAHRPSAPSTKEGAD